MWLLKYIFLALFQKTLGHHYWCNYFGTIPPEAYSLDNRTLYYAKANSHLKHCGVVGGVIKPGQKYLLSPCVGLQKIFLFNAPFQVLCTSNPVSLQWTNDLDKKNQAIQINTDQSEKPCYISKWKNISEENYGTTYFDDGIHHYINEQNQAITIENFKFQFLIDKDSLKRQVNLETPTDNFTYIVQNSTNKLTEDLESEILKELKSLSQKIDNIEKTIKDLRQRRKLFTIFSNDEKRRKNEDVEIFLPRMGNLRNHPPSKKKSTSSNLINEDSKPETIIHLTNLGKNATINLDVDKPDKNLANIGKRYKRSKSKKSGMVEQLLQMEKIFEENSGITENILDQIIPTSTDNIILLTDKPSTKPAEQQKPKKH